MAGDPDAASWLRRAAARWRESWDAGERPIESVGPPDRRAQGVAARRRRRRGGRARALGARARRRTTADSPIGRYAAALALLALGALGRGTPRAESLRERDDFPHDVADALASDRCARRRRLRRGSRVGRRVVRDARASYLEDVAVADTALVLAALARRRGIDYAAARPSRRRFRASRVSPCSISGVERHRDRLQRLRLVLELGQLVRRARSAARAPSRRRASRAPARCGTHRPPRRGRSRAGARAAAPPAGRSRDPAARISGPTLKCFATGRYGFSRPAAVRELDQAGAVEHPHVEVEVARVDGQRGRELAVRQRLIGLAEHLQHLQPQRVAERLQLLRALDLQDVARGGLGLRLRHPRPVWTLRRASRKTSTRTGASRSEAGGHSAVISAAEGAGHGVGLLRARDQEDDPARPSGSPAASSSPGRRTARARRARWSRAGPRPSSCGEPGKSDAMCPSGPSPSSSRSSSTPSSAASSSSAASAGWSSPRIRCTSRRLSSSRSSSVSFASR